MKRDGNLALRSTAQPWPWFSLGIPFCWTGRKWRIPASAVTLPASTPHHGWHSRRPSSTKLLLARLLDFSYKKNDYKPHRVCPHRRKLTHQWKKGRRHMQRRIDNIDSTLLVWRDVLPDSCWTPEASESMESYRHKVFSIYLCCCWLNLRVNHIKKLTITEIEHMEHYTVKLISEKLWTAYF